MLIINTTRDTVIAYKAQFAETFKQRLIGLLGHSHLNRGEGLILKNTSSIHTIGMRFVIDVLFVNKKSNVVMGVIAGMKPFRLSKLYPFCDVIEVPQGTIKDSGTREGDIIQIKPV